MSDSLARRQTADILHPQDSSSGIGLYTQTQLDTVRNLIGMGIMAYDRTYAEMEAYVQRPGRSADHQKYIVERASSLLNTHNVAVDTTIHGAISKTLDTRYVQEAQAPRIIEVPQRGIIPRLFGR